jgi:hypothetical protein
LHRVRNLALPLRDSRDLAAVEPQVASSTAALEAVPPPEAVDDVAAEPVVAPRWVVDVPEGELPLPQPAINAAPAIRTAARKARPWPWILLGVDTPETQGQRGSDAAIVSRRRSRLLGSGLV